MVYLVEIKEKEKEILRRFPEFLRTMDFFISSLDIAPYYSWYLIELPIDRVVSHVQGDIDILAGRLEPTDSDAFNDLLNETREKLPTAHTTRVVRWAANAIALDGGLKWPPSLDYLIGIETKCSYLPATAPGISEETMKSKKSSRQKIEGIRNQVEKLVDLGLDRIGLFDFIATPPANGTGNEPWWGASRIAGASMDSMKKVLPGRLSPGSVAGHGVCALSGVNGRAELGSGAYHCEILTDPTPNLRPSSTPVEGNRKEMQEKLAGILAAVKQPHNLPAVFFYDGASRTIVQTNEGWTTW